MANQSNIEPLADALGQIKAEIAVLETKEQALRAEIIAIGHDAVEGNLFRVTVSRTVRETLDSKAMREKLEALGVSHQWFNAHTRHTSVTTVRCSARTDAAEAA